MNRNDPRLEKVEQITIDWETFKKALRRNYLDSDYINRYRDRSFVLRLYPPFNTEMEVEYYESMQGRHYNNEWDEKPFHINPELILLEGCDSNPFRWVEWPNEQNTRDALTDDEIENEGGIEKAVEEGREFFWNELRHDLPDSINLGKIQGHSNYPVDINWVFEDE